VPIISLDACAIKNKCHGVIMGATGLDGERNMVPLAFAICPMKTRRTGAGFWSDWEGCSQRFLKIL
jgi:hypothetical protein